MAVMKRQRAVFIDKDGTLVENLPYNVNPDRITLARRSHWGLRALAEHGYAIVIVSNQSGVARGLFVEDQLECVQARLRTVLLEIGVPLAGFYYCPHHPEGRVKKYARRCLCRKPAPGLFIQAAAAQNLDLTQSWMLGDILDDIEAGHRAGCRTILLDIGNETEWHLAAMRRPDYRASCIDSAAHIILGQPAASDTDGACSPSFVQGHA